MFSLLALAALFCWLDLASAAGCCFSDQMSGSAYEIVKTVDTVTEIREYPNFPRMSCAYGPDAVMTSMNYTWAVDYLKSKFYEHVYEYDSQGALLVDEEIYVDFTGIVHEGYFIQTYPNGTQDCVSANVNALDILLPNIGDLRCYARDTPELPDVSFKDCELNLEDCDGLMPHSPAQCQVFHRSKWYPTEGLTEIPDLVSNITVGIEHEKCTITTQFMSLASLDGSSWEGSRADFYDVIDSLPNADIFQPPAICSGARISSRTTSRRQRRLQQL